MIGLQTLTAQAGENLTDKYETAKKQIMTTSVMAYSNGLTAIMLQLKQKGELDSFLVVQAEQKRLVADAVIDDGLTNSVESVASLARKVIADRNAKIAVQLRRYVAQLEVNLKQAMMADKIDDAKFIKEVLDPAKSELAQLDSTVPSIKKEPALPTPDVPKDWVDGTAWKQVNDHHTRKFKKGNCTAKDTSSGFSWTAPYIILNDTEVQVFDPSGRTDVYTLLPGRKLQVGGNVFKRLQ